MASYQENNSGTLPFYNDAIQNLLNQGQALIPGQGSFSGPEHTVAGFSPLQTQAQNLTQQSVGNYQPLLNQSQQAIHSGQAAANYDPNKLSQFMNPYLSGVVGEIGRLGAQQFQNDIAPSLRNNFSSLGQYGSTRQAAMLSNAAAQNQREVLGQQSQALNTGYNNAINAYQNWAQMGVNANQQAGTQLGNLAQAQQQLSLGDIGALSTAGLSQQQLAQKQADLPYLNWQQAQQFPWQQLNNWANLFKAGTPQQGSAWNASFAEGGIVENPVGAYDLSEGKESIVRKINKLSNADERTNAFEAFVRQLSQESDDSDAMLDDYTNTVPSHHDLPYAVSSRASVPELIRSAFDERVAMLDRLRNSPELSPLEEEPTTSRLGEAMLRAGAQGPANWGQLIGRSGTSYFDKLAADAAENKNRAIQRFKLEDSIAPEVPKTLSGLGLSGGKGSSPVFVRGTDGKSYMVDRNDPSNPVEIGAGHNFPKIVEAADKYATLATKHGNYKNVAEQEADYERFKNQYIMDRISGKGEIAPTDGVPAAPAIVSRSGASTIIQTPGEKKSDEKIGEETGKQYGSLQESAAGAQATLNSLSAMEEALKGYDTGKFTPITTTVSQWFDDLGIKTDPNLGPKEAFAAGIKDLALSLKNAGDSNKMPGAMSDSDRTFLQSMAPSLSNTPEGNRLIIEIYRRLSKRNIEIAKLARQYKNREGGRGYDDGFLDQAQAYAEQHPLFADLMKKQPSKGRTFDSMPDASQYDGKRIRGEDGSIYRSVNGQWVKE